MRNWLLDSLLLSVACLSHAADARLSRRQSADVPGRPESYPAHIINTPIDHFPTTARYEPHTNATFKQRYFFDDTYYKPGGPVFLYISGETSGPSRFINLQTGIIQLLMQATNGLGVILENRYYGDSYPFANSTTDNLAYLTQEQTIADSAYFAQHATFPGVNGNKSLCAPATPWIMYGGSLAGAETAFALKTYNDLFYGGIAASGTTKAKLAYPEWYSPIQKYAPQDCVSRINGIIDNFDMLVNTGNEEAISKFKGVFGLESVTDNRDFAQTIAFPLGGPFDYPTSTWQELNWSPSYNALNTSAAQLQEEIAAPDFFYFCSNVTNVNSPANNTAIDHEFANYTNGVPWTGLGNYAAYVKQIVLPTCPSGKYNSPYPCFGTQYPKYWSNIANSGDRSYLYTTCTEQGAYQVAPASGPSLISRVLQVNYTQQWCDWAFPPGKYNSIPSTPNLSYWNKYGGYSVTARGLAHVDGDQDVWLDLCYHSNDAPLRQSTDSEPELLITGSGHHWDSYGILDVEGEPQFIREAHKWEIRIVQRWLQNFSSWKPKDEL